jgi:hypothetical protein
MGSYEYVFIIGAAKCGTTALADLIGGHPQVSLSHPKEPDFFTNVGIERGFEWYDSCFHQKLDCRYRLDASVSYSAGWEGGSKIIANRIFDFSPRAKIIYVVRDPVSRAWSSYWHSKRNLKEQGSFESILNDPNSDHITAGQFYQRVSEYLEFFPRENLLVLTQHNISLQPQDTLNEVFSFLGLNTVSVPDTKLNRKVNNSYQFSPIGYAVLKVIPLSLVKKLAFWANRNMPEWFNRSIRNFVGNPMPEIPDESAKAAARIFKDDLQIFENEFDVRIRKDI